jgi:hypothetical protein
MAHAVKGSKSGLGRAAPQVAAISDRRGRLVRNREPLQPKAAAFVGCWCKQTIRCVACYMERVLYARRTLQWEGKRGTRRRFMSVLVYRQSGRHAQAGTNGACCGRRGE